jgi:putative sterol carrier protein
MQSNLFSTIHQIVLDLKNVKVYAGDDPAECTLTCEDSVMTALGSGTLKAQEALAQDKLDIDGQLDLVMLLSPYVSSL